MNYVLGKPSSERSMPEHAGSTHNTEGSDDMPAHIEIMLAAPSPYMPVLKGKLALGTWQAV